MAGVYRPRHPERMVRQKSELFQKREGDERQRLAAQIGTSLLNRLERLKRQTAMALDADLKSFAAGRSFLHIKDLVEALKKKAMDPGRLTAGSSSFGA